MRTRCIFVLTIVLMLAAWTFQCTDTSVSSGSERVSQSPSGPAKNGLHIASDFVSPIDSKPYLVIEMTDASVPARGNCWSSVLNSTGIVSHVVTMDEIIAMPTMLEGAPAVLLDASLGSANGSYISDSFMRSLVSYDIALVVTGRAAWLVHDFRGASLPPVTAPVSQRLLTAEGYEAATFLISPIVLSVSSLLTEETNLQLPVDRIQTEHSRIVNLTGTEHPANVAVLRYDSYPLDMFLFGPEDPAKLTDQGRGLLVNTIAFAVSLRETSTTKAISQLQASHGSLLAGGYHYLHEPTLKAAYAAIHSAKSLLDSSNWSTWSSQHQSLVRGLLDSLFVDYGSQAGFMNSASENTVGIQSTAEGLWVAVSMGLASRYNSSKLVSYLASRQDTGGGFSNDITTTHLVVESLALSGRLGSINTVSLESWLRSCVIDGTKTSNPDLWGALGQNPNSITPKTSYAAQYVLSLQSMGKTHGDPLKLTSWIRTRMSNGDGSYKEVLGSGGELVSGTSSALTAMAMMNTLSPQNRTTGLSWLASNQLPSGGFGLTEAATDAVGKAWPTLSVARCIQAVGEQSRPMAMKVISFVLLCETEIGFEAMDPIPSLMWSDWLTSISRLSHSEGFSDNGLANTYADGMVGWSQYPGNVTAATSIEYGPTQYRTQSVWTQYFGAAMYSALGTEIPDNAVSAAESYIYQCQDSSGHYKPTSFMGTPHVQYTVAAVEALYLTGNLDTIRYRSNLESAILSEFRSGHWSIDGWTLRPFANQQSAIDWLCTRAALRLGILDSAKAQQIAGSVRSRIQYSDVWALSRDIATLALLNKSGFSVGLDCFDSHAVIHSLGSTPFPNGWLNSTELWQPVYTAGALEMISILGLRTRIVSPSSSSMNASGPLTAEIGTTLTLGLSISPLSDRHDVLAFCFGDWLLFRNVHDTDSVELTIPSSHDVLGPCNISVILQDYGITRAYSIVPLRVLGVIQGSLNIEAVRLPRGHNVNGTVDWTLDGGSGADLTDVRISLGNGLTHRDWEYSTQSPFFFSLPTSGFPVGSYNLTVQLEKPYCQTLALGGKVTLLEPVRTYLSASPLIQGKVNEILNVGWSLRYVNNGSEIRFQQVKITVRDESGASVHERSGPVSPFSWVPGERGNYSFVLSFPGNESLEGSSFVGVISVHENMKLQWFGAQVQNQYTSGSYAVRLSTQNGIPLSGYTVQVTVTTPSSTILLYTQMVTNSTGFARVDFPLNENGVFLLDASVSNTGFLIGCSTSQGLVSWSTSSLEVGGTTPEALVETTWNLWAHLTDSASTGTSGMQVTLRIIFLPSTLVYQQTLTTNFTGYIKIQWSGNTAGAYRLEAVFNGSISRGNAARSVTFQLRIPLVITMSVGDNPQVGQGNWIDLSALDNRGNPVAGLIVGVVVKESSGQVVYQATVTTLDGVIRLVWLPSDRGINRILTTIERQSWYEKAERADSIAVTESPQILAETSTTIIAPCSVPLVITAKCQDQSRLPGVTLVVVAMLDGVVILNSSNTTSSVGEIHFILQVGHPGTLSVNITCPSQQWLNGVSQVSEHTVLGFTSINLISPGQPVNQGSLVGVVATLTDYSGHPIVGAQINITIAWPNGTVCSFATKTTGAGGKCSIAYSFGTIGDFVIKASFAGAGLQAPSSRVEPQRVYVVPTIIVEHDLTYVLGESVDLGVGLRDAFGNSIPGKILPLRIDSANVTLFLTQVNTVDGLMHVHWTPTCRGQVSIRVSYAGDTYCYANSTVTFSSIMEVATGTLLLSTKQIDMFSTVILQYFLNTQGNRNGIAVRVEVLGVNLVPVWTAESRTNSSGMVELSYAAQQAYGILMIQAEPLTDECLLGAGAQKQLVVMTNGHLSALFEPSPPCASNVVNVSIQVQDELGSPIDGISVTVRIYDPYGQQVRLGSMSMSATLQVRNGTARIAFIPQYPGLHTLEVSSSGSVVVHSFQSTTLHTVYSQTSLAIVVQCPQMEVGTYLNVAILLADYQGSPMCSRAVTMMLNGPGSRLKGPIDATTNATGHVTWTVLMDEIGLWTLDAHFTGIGVYLAADSSSEIDVRYGTVLVATLTNTTEVVAGRDPALLQVLLSDSGGTPLEGFSIHYEVYHESIGPCLQGNVIQSGQRPVLLNLTLPLAGNYTIVISFAGTTHYLPSSVAVCAWARGTTSVTIQCASRVDRSEDAHLVLRVLDESSIEMAIDGLGLQIQLIGPNGSVSLAGLCQVSGSKLILPLRGFVVGEYHITAHVPECRLRLGCSYQFSFTVATVSAFVMTERMLPGTLAQKHSVVFVLVDSLGESVFGKTVFVSLYDTEGHEIYGNPLTTRTPILTTYGGNRIEWTPSEVGNYTLVLAFDGDLFRTAASAEIVILTRYESSLILQIPSQIAYGDALSLSVVLSGPISKIQGAQVTVIVSLGGIEERHLSVVTDSRGSAMLSIEGLVAGSHIVLVVYEGSSAFNNCTKSAYLAILPVVTMKVSVNPDAIVQSTCMLTVDYSVAGLGPEWKGNLSVDAYGPEGSLVGQWTFRVTTHGSEQIPFVPDREGTYRLNITLSGLPVIALDSRAFALLIRQSVPIQLDESTVPVVSEIGIVAAVALFLSRKLKKMESVLPGEWEP